MTQTESPAPQTAPHADDFLATVSYSLRQRPRFIPPKFFYDVRGSQLFDLICTTPEYYPTRTETTILDQYGAQMAELIGASCVLIEFGSGSATKTPLLLRHMADDTVYVPIDICESHLLQSAERLKTMFPAMQIQPLCADYTAQLPSMPQAAHTDQRRVIFFPGSTIGNYTPNEAVRLLRHAAQLVGDDGALLIGVDCKKSPDLLNAAYNDADGHTAAFNLNLLTRLQRELGAQLDADGFNHYAYYNVVLGRVEMHLVSQRKQFIQLEGETFHFEEGETIHTENSYKYTTQEFQQLTREAGWHPKMLWTDHNGLFNVYYLSLSAAEPRHLPQQMR
ncbi:MAG TPA: L-histidine N(alpha)-methyltransferase [Gallionella sp.]|nr:L-histidine N(alpha)-methyltransferase [Gallionella sp.]